MDCEHDIAGVGDCDSKTAIDRRVRAVVVCASRARAGVARGGRAQTTERSSSEQKAARVVILHAVLARVIRGESRVGQVVTKRSVDDGCLLLRVGGA